MCGGSVGADALRKQCHREASWTISTTHPVPAASCRSFQTSVEAVSTESGSWISAVRNGGYAIEFAKRGATTVGIEGRAAWLEHANASKARHGSVTPINR